MDRQTDHEAPLRSLKPARPACSVQKSANQCSLFCLCYEPSNIADSETIGKERISALSGADSAVVNPYKTIALSQHTVR